MRRAGRRRLRPQAVDQRLAADELACLQYEQRERESLLRPSERNLPGGPAHLEGAKHPEFHHSLPPYAAPHSDCSELRATCKRAPGR